MHPVEQNLREKAEAFKVAFLEARDAGFSVTWPVRGFEVGDIIISGTAKVEQVTYADGSPIERDADGVAVGQPLDLTDEERAVLPPLSDASEGGYLIGEATGIPLVGVTVPSDGVERAVTLEPAKGRKK